MRSRGLNRILKGVVPPAWVRFRGPAASNRIALTFDDGPVPGVTDRVVDALATRGHQATFFLLGRKAELRPGLVNAIVKAGCEVGNHFYSHRATTRIAYSELTQELERTDLILGKSAEKPKWVRPPGGGFSWRLLWYLKRRRTKSSLILWSVFVPFENQRSAREITDTLNSAALTAGDIVLLHDDRPAVVDALPGILDLLDEKGLRSVSLTDLLCPNPQIIPYQQVPKSSRPVA